MCAWLAGAGFSCARHAELPGRQEPGSFVQPPPSLSAGPLEPVGAPLDQPSCGSRPSTSCDSTDKVPSFGDWIDSLIDHCDKATSCGTNGDLEATMGAQGCVTEIRMNQPNPAFIACLVKQVNAVRCPFDSVQKASWFFGLGNSPPCQLSSCNGDNPLDPCPPGYVCDDALDLCVLQ